jgi:hypothetical protein
MEIYYNNYLANYFVSIIPVFGFCTIIFSYYSIIQTKTVTLIKEQQYTPNQTVKQI